MYQKEEMLAEILMNLYFPQVTNKCSWDLGGVLVGWGASSAFSCTVSMTCLVALLIFMHSSLLELRRFDTLLKIFKKFLKLSFL